MVDQEDAASAVGRRDRLADRYDKTGHCRSPQCAQVVSLPLRPSSRGTFRQIQVSCLHLHLS